MCGITGIFSKEASSLNGLMEEMLNSISYRGPDSYGIFSNNNIVLGHRRLSIQDTSSHANQPMQDNSKRYTLVFNGEIYNFKKLYAQLKNEYKFKTTSDTEVILASWLKWGIDSLQHFEGMFAFAIWDDFEKKLYLARDRFGEKPLYFFKFQQNNLAFASELKSLLKHPECPKSINHKAISQFLSLNYTLTDQCILDGIEKLPPAHYCIFSEKYGLQIKQYWNLANVFKADKWQASENELIEQFNAIFADVIKDCSLSDVPLGLFLSGGVDSSAVASALHMANLSSNLSAFTIGFENESFNELEKAKQVANSKNLNHKWEILPNNYSNSLEKIIENLDEPFADTSIIPTFILSAFAKKSATVCLSGDGGDELFGGYETYKADKLHKLFRYFPFKNIASKCINNIPTNFNKVSFDYKLKQFFKGLEFSSEKAHYSWRTIFSESEKFNLIRNEFKNSIHEYDPFLSFQKFYSEVSDCDIMEQHYYVDMKTWLVDDVLVKVDRMSMLNSLEVRAPFLNHRLAEWIIRLPTKYKLNGFSTKYFLKKSQEKHLPNSILYGKKEGFSSPVANWISKNHIDQIVNNNLIKEFFNTQEIINLWQLHKQKKANCGYKLFGLLCLSLWFHKFQNLK